MHIDPHRPQARSPKTRAVALVLSIARTLHRAAASDSLSQSLPVLRRVLASDTLRGVSLPELRQRRRMVQRKHILRTLAVEAGFSSWESYRRALTGMSTAQLQHFDLLRRQVGYPNLWFATPAEAQRHTDRHGGRALPVGRHGVVLIDHRPRDGPRDRQTLET